MTGKIPEPIAFGCTIYPGERDARLTWTGQICDLPAGRTARGCYHLELHATKLSEALTALHDVSAEVCMPDLHHAEEYAGYFSALVDDDPLVPTNKRTKFAVISALPEIHAIAQAKRAADARGKILG